MLAILNFVVAGFSLLYFVVLGGIDTLKVWKEHKQASALGLSLICVGLTSAFRHLTAASFLLANPAANPFIIGTMFSILPWAVALVVFWFWSKRGASQVVLTDPKWLRWTQRVVLFTMGIGFAGLGFGLGAYGLPGSGAIVQWGLAALYYAMVTLFARAQSERIARTGSVELSGLLFTGLFASEAADHLVSGSLIGTVLPAGFLATVDSFGILAMASVFLLAKQAGYLKKIGSPGALGERQADEQASLST